MRTKFAQLINIRDYSRDYTKGSASVYEPYQIMRRRLPAHPWSRASSSFKWFVENQIPLTFSFILLVHVAQFLGWESASQFFYLSYYDASTNLYTKGIYDISFVFSWVVGYTFLRAILIRFVLQSLGSRCGIKKARALVRFTEQAYLFLYYILVIPVGMRIICTSPYARDMRQYWIGYPHEQYTMKFKAYYLLQLAFWIQQIYVLHIEKRRKDYVLMFAHHIITSSLLVGSYLGNFTRVGSAILVIMDIADILLASTKLLRYLGMKKLCDACFILFTVVWVGTRHYLFSLVAIHTALESPKYVAFEWNPAQGKFFTRTILNFFLFLFALLQLLFVCWFYFIARILLNVIRGGFVHDNRSDEEEDE
ncbi:uncharacterized protein VTP21DRAFT_1300 [Calcarisporiella thermophila]|uniref:uncharacterized protein n=1 Tax=Calcarisporiella thermophila TaxID=911321 RepID=UPI0037434B3D